MTKIAIYDGNTGEVTEREMTSNELEQWEKDQEEAITQATKKAEAEADKAALLDRLGITADEAKLLLN